MPYELIDTYDGFSSLEPVWKDLELRASSTVFQSYDFLSSWLEHVGRNSGIKPVIVSYSENNVVKAIFPACVAHKYHLKFLTWLGGFHIVDYGNILMDPAADISVSRFVDEALLLIKKHVKYQVIHLHNVRSSSPINGVLEKKLRKHRVDVAPYTPLLGDFESYLDSLKKNRKKLKSDTLRQMKRLSELGELSYSVHGGNDPVARDVLNVFIEQKKKRYEVTSVRGVLFHDGYDKYYLDQVRNNPNVHLSSLTLGDKIIAAHLGYAYKDTYYYLMPSYDSEYEKYSPGRILLYNLIKTAYEAGTNVFDFCIGDEKYKYEWASVDETLTSYISGGPLGTLFKAAYIGRTKLRKCFG